jgi:hypothetical protein
MELNVDDSSSVTVIQTEESSGHVVSSTQQESTTIIGAPEQHKLVPDSDENSVIDNSVKYSPRPDIYEQLFVKKTVSDVSLKYGATGENRRTMVERQRQEREREEDAALSFKPLLISKSPKKSSNTPVHKRETFVDKELTFTPTITEKGKHLERPKNSKQKCDLLFSSPGAGRTRESIEQRQGGGGGGGGGHNKNGSFTPEITKVAKKLPSDEKLKGGPRLYAKSKSRELERQNSTPRKTKEELECTFKPVSTYC